MKQICAQIREEIIRSVAQVGTGHVGGSLSIVEILALLYFKHMRIDPAHPKMAHRDRFVLSKGHAGPALYAVLALRGYFPREQLLTLNAPDTLLPSHADMNRTPGVDMTTGSLGQGFSCAVGAALGAKIARDGARIYTIIGDGESQEGQIWESAMFAASHQLNNLIAFTDVNGYQMDGTTDEVNALSPLKDKWSSFGWNVLEADGHDPDALDQAICRAKESDKPTMILARTVKGKGVSFIEAMGAGNHSMALSREQAEMAIAEIRERG